MALLSFADPTPRAYRLKGGNAAWKVSTEPGTSPARRIATRYEKRANNYLAMIHIGMILLWIKPFADTA
jgi:hypothetical protein